MSAAVFQKGDLTWVPADVIMYGVFFDRLKKTSMPSTAIVIPFKRLPQHSDYHNLIIVYHDGAPWYVNPKSLTKLS